MNNTTQQLQGGPRKRPLLLTAAALLGIAAAPVLFSAPASAQSGPEFHACYVPGSGTVYRIKEPGLRQACSSPNHVAFSWKPEGEPGRDGVLGYEIVTSESEPITSPAQFGSRTARCPSGKQVLGGGARILTPDGGTVSSWDIKFLQSHPTSDGTGWVSHFDITNPFGRAFVHTVYAICASVAGGV